MGILRSRLLLYKQTDMEHENPFVIEAIQTLHGVCWCHWHSIKPTLLCGTLRRPTVQQKLVKVNPVYLHIKKQQNWKFFSHQTVSKNVVKQISHQWSKWKTVHIDATWHDETKSLDGLNAIRRTIPTWCNVKEAQWRLNLHIFTFKMLHSLLVISLIVC